MEKNNKIIAEFLNWEKIDCRGCVDYVLPKSLAGPIYRFTTRDMLDFDTDWNWLMEVVEKIESLGYWINLHGNISYYNFEIGNNDNNFKTIIGEEDSKFKAVYDGIIKFINFYNKQKEEID